VSGEIYESIADYLPVGVLVIGGRGGLVEANQPALDLLGLDDRAFGRPDFRELLESEPLRDALVSTDDEIVRLRVSEGGKDLAAEVRKLPERDDGATLLLLQDISLVSAASLMKRNFIFDLLHKLRTPLTTIVSVLSMATNNRLDTSRVDASELLRMGAKQADRLNLLLARLRDLFLVETQTLDAELRVEQATVAAILGQQVEDFRSRIAGKGQTLVEDFGDEEALALADRAVLGRAFELVLLNAHQYTPEGGSIRLGATRQNGSIVVRIEDNGPGIPEEELPRVFDRFYRGTAATTAEVEGEGLGLYLARHLLLAQGATIHLDSSPGQGTEVEILIPSVEGRA
jgi:signal transduction histidine kinase